MATDPHAIVAPYALDALDDDEERAFEEHLAVVRGLPRGARELREAAAALAYGAAGRLRRPS